MVAAHHRALSERCERNPDRWLGEYRPIVAEARGLIAEQIKARGPEDVVMVENASTGVNTVLRHLEPPLAQGDKVLYLSCAYGMTQSVLRFLQNSVGIELVMVGSRPQPVRLRLLRSICPPTLLTGTCFGGGQVDLVPTEFKSSDAVIAAVTATINEHGGPGSFAMGVISHLSSVPAVVLPVARFCDALQGVPVLVDGARKYPAADDSTLAMVVRQSRPA